MLKSVCTLQTMFPKFNFVIFPSVTLRGPEEVTIILTERWVSERNGQKQQRYACVLNFFAKAHVATAPADVPRSTSGNSWGQAHICSALGGNGEAC